MNTEPDNLGGELVEQVLIPGVEPVSVTAAKIAQEVKRRDAKRSATVRRSAVIGHGALFDTARPGDLFAQVEADAANVERQARADERQQLGQVAARRYGALYGDEHHPCGQLFTWRGVVIIARYNPAYFAAGQAHVAFHQVHPPPGERIERRTLSDGKVLEFSHVHTDAQPLTDTGYRSHFTQAATVEGLGGPAAFICRELEAAAISNKAWAKAHP
jgi:hypothetical protein